MTMAELVLQYSCCNEDARSELAALGVRGRRVLSIAAAGERAFGLLLGDPREVVAVDRNPAQIHLARLKAAAIARLERAAYLAFVGIRDDAGAGRLATYRKLKSELPDDAQQFWDGRQGDVERGLLFSGRTEVGIARAAPVFRLLLGGHVARLRACKTQGEQAELARSMLRRRRVRAVLALIFNPISGRFLLRDRVYYGDARRDAASYLQDRMVETLEHHRFDDCFILSLFFDGDLRKSRALPEDLTEDNYTLVQRRIGRVRFETSCVIKYLERQPAASVDAFSLSDLGGYLSVPEFRVLLGQVERVASADGAVCIREYISQPTQRVQWPASLTRDHALERRLQVADRSVGCTFVCGRKGGAGASAGGARGAAQA